MDAITCVCLTRWPERATMLADALRSFHLQDHAAKRLVVVNDGTPLRSVDPRVVVLNAARQTIGAKRNLGLAAVATPWVATWDDDDFALPEHLATLLATGEPWVRSRRAWLAEARLRVVDTTNDELHCTTLLATRIARAAGGYPAVDYAEDASLATRLRMHLGLPPGSGARCEAMTYVHRRHRANVSRGHSTAGLDEQARRGLAARQWWTTDELDTVNDRVRSLLAEPVPVMVEPIVGRTMRPTAVVDSPRRMPFHVDAIVSPAFDTAPLEAAGCIRNIYRRFTTYADAMRLGKHVDGPGAWLIVPPDVRGLRADHVCRLVEAVRAGDRLLSRGLADGGELVNKVGPWLPAGPGAVRVARRALLAKVPPSLRDDLWLGPALDEAARREGIPVESIVLDGLAADTRSLADRALAAWEAAKHVRSSVW